LQAALGLGCMSMSALYGQPADRQEMIKLIRAAFDRGVTQFDTAESYGPFINEELAGEALLPIRDKVVIATKFGFDIDLKTSERRGGTNSRPEHIKAVADACLKRLRTDHIDIFYPAPRRSGGAYRRRGRRRQGVDRRWQDQALRPVGSGRPDNPPHVRVKAAFRGAFSYSLSEMAMYLRKVLGR
jgi:hypothetical protein